MFVPRIDNWANDIRDVEKVASQKLFAEIMEKGKLCKLSDPDRLGTTDPDRRRRNDILS